MGGALSLLAAAFAAFALMHPELVLPWSDKVSCVLFALYALFTVLVFLMPRFKRASLPFCGIAAVVFIAAALAVIYIGTRGTARESSLYLIFALLLACAAGCAAYAAKTKNRSGEDT